MSLSAIFATLLAGLALQSAPVPGQYVGEWPQAAENRALWVRYQMGLPLAMYQDRSDGEPALQAFADPLFLDHRHICGVYMSVGDDDAQAYDYLIFITRLASLDFGDETEERALAVQVVSRDASEAELDEYCPNIPADMRADFFNAAERYRQPPVVFDPEGAGMLHSAQGRAMMHSLYAIMPEWPDGTHVFNWGHPVYREGAQICAEYLLSTPSQRAWQAHWFVARLDSFEETEAGPNHWPVRMLNSDASPEDVLEACPSLAGWGDFQFLTTPENWFRAAIPNRAIERSLTPALLARIDHETSSEASISVRYTGPPSFHPQGVSRVCGNIGVRLISEHQTQSRLAFVAEIDATRLPPGDSSPFPTWNVSVNDISFPETPAAYYESCPSLTLDPPEGFGQNPEHMVGVSLTDAIGSHLRGDRICHFWEDDTMPPRDAERPDYPRDIAVEPCRSVSYDRHIQIVDDVNASDRRRTERMPAD